MESRKKPSGGWDVVVPESISRAGSSSDTCVAARGGVRNDIHEAGE